jgi:hypothetical protein
MTIALIVIGSIILVSGAVGALWFCGVFDDVVSNSDAGPTEIEEEE